VLAILWMAALPATAGPPSERANGASSSEGLNTISALRVEKDDKGSYLRLKSRQTPSFSVYKLRDPLRLVLDVSNSELTAREGSREVDNGAISRVALSTHQEKGRARVRLIVGFDQASHYDVRTEDNDIVVFVEDREGTTDSGARVRLEKTLNQKQQKLADVRQKYERASGKLDTLESRLDQARGEVETLEQKLESSKIEAKRKKQLRSQLADRTERLESLKQRLDERSGRVETLRSRLDELERERKQARSRLDELKQKLASQRKRASKKEKQLEKLRAERKKRSRKLDALESKHTRARERLKALRKKLEVERQEAERKADELAELQEVRRSRSRKLEAQRSKYRQSRDELEETQSKLETLRSELQKLEAREQSADGSKKERLQAKLKSKSRALERLESTLDQQQRATSALENRVDTLERKRKQARRKVASLQKELEAQKERARRERKKLRNKQQQARQRVATLETKLQKQRKRAQRKRKELKRRLERQKSQIQTKRQTLQQARQKVDSTRSKLENYRKKLDSRDDTIADLETRVERLEQKRRQRSGEAKRKTSEKLEELERRLERERDTIASLKRKRNRERKELKTLQRQQDKARDRLESVRARLEKKQQRLDELDALQTKQKQAEQQLQQTREQLEQKKAKLAELDNLEDKREKAQHQLERARRKLEEKQSELSELDSLERQRKQARQQLEKARRRLETKKNKLSELDSLERQQQEAETQLERARQQLDAKKDKLDELQSLESKKKRTRRQLEQARSKLESKKQSLAALESSERETSAETEPGPTARAVPMHQNETNTIQDIRLETRDGESRIIVELERPGKYKRLPWKESRAVMMLNNVELPEHLDRKIEAEGSSGAVQFVSSHPESKGKVRMEAELASNAREQISQEGDTLVWEFAPRASQSHASRRGDRGNPTKETARPRATNDTPSSPPARHRDDSPNGANGTNAAPRAPNSSGPVTSAPPRQSSTPRTVTDPSKIKHVPGMARTEVTMDFRDADIQNVLRLFAKQGGVNIIAGDNVAGNITLRLRSVPLDQAFLIVLQSLNLGFEMRGDVIRVATQKQLIEEQKARQKARQRQQKTRPLEVFLMPISYASADDMVDQVNRLLSPRGSVSVDERTNTLIIKDLPENIRSVRELVGALDTQVPQVLIEARIVETNDTFSQEFGIQWGGDFTMSQGNGNPTGLAFPNVLGVGGGATDGQTPTSGTSENPNFAVNLPAPAGTGSGGALGLTMGSISGNVNLNLRLSAAEESGHAKIVSAPKVLTLDNREATISQGTSIPISVVSAAGVQTVFVDATLELTVTPHVTPDGNVQMEITATKNEPDFQNTGARGDPTIIRKSAETELLVGDGETTVIGGIYTRNSGSSVTGIPILHQIPILGSLFKQTGRNERRSELLIFITPRIVNRTEALGGVSAGDVVGQGSSMGSSQSSGGGSASGGGQGGGGGR
jgi:type IV pilus assembly protein PilQ